MLAAIVSIYKPEEEYIKNINNLGNLFDLVILVINKDIGDNSDYKSLFYQTKKVKIIQNYKNFGVAKAMNQGFLILKNQSNIQWACLLDQDSLFVKNPSILLKEFIDFYDKPAVFFAKYFEKKKLKHNNQKENFVIVNYGIVSGMFIHQEIYKKFLFREDLFIDLCDREFCRRLKKYKYPLFSSSSECLQHNFGMMQQKKIINIKFKIYNYSPLRLFLMTRNRIILKGESNSFLFLYLLKLLKKIFFQSIMIFLFEDQKFKKIYGKLMGVYYGLNKNSFDSLDEIKKLLRV